MSSFQSVYAKVSKRKGRKPCERMVSVTPFEGVGNDYCSSEKVSGERDYRVIV